MQTVPSSAPPKLGAKEFEALILERFAREERQGVLTGGRYGVSVVPIPGKKRGQPEWTPISSLPDFEGVFLGGQQFVVEAKVTSGASFAIHDDKFKARQLRHLLRRSRFGVVSALVIHFNQRVLKTRTDEAATWLFPVSDRLACWQEQEGGDWKTLTRDDCAVYGVPVEWNRSKRETKDRPDLHAAMVQMRQEFKEVVA